MRFTIFGSGDHRPPLQESLTDNGDRNLPTMRIAAVFEEKDPLPRTELHSSINNRNSLARPSQRHADVRRHVVGAFVIVLELLIFRDEFVEKSLEITPRGRRGIFHCDQAATGMLDKHRDCSVAHTALVDLTLNLVRDFVGALAVRLDDKIHVLHSHSRRAYAACGHSAMLLPNTPRVKVIYSVDTRLAPQHSVAWLIFRDEMA
jgi:hypothetical protein